MFLSKDDAHAIAQRIIDRSQADACSVTVDGGEDHSLRFAKGSATTNLSVDHVSIKISSHIGQRIGSVTTSLVDEASLESARRRSEQIAQMLPIDPEYIAPLGPQHYETSSRYYDNENFLDLDTLASCAQQAITQGDENNVTIFGCLNSIRRFESLTTSTGLFAFDRRSEMDLSITARTPNDDWSGWAGEHVFFPPHLNPGAISSRACKKAAFGCAPVDLEPGAYTVILEPEATAELAFWIMSAMDARAADEGRSFYARPGGGTFVGEKLFDEKLTIRVDPSDALAPESAVGYEGVPHRARRFIDQGIVRTLYLSRAWAHKSGQEPVPFARNFVVDGGDMSIEDMIRATKRGVLVTRLWYTNLLDPRTLLLTGLTRDGNFLIENGRITAPARNMRFNQSLGKLFANIAALGPTQRTWRTAGTGAPAAPPMMAHDFHFSSKSSGI